MILFQRVRLWIRALLLKGTVEVELDEEFRYHLDREIELSIQSGMEPEEARRVALVRFGGVERYKEQVRDSRGTRPLEDSLLDVRYGVRQLRKHPAFTVVALLSLSLGIGANTAIFSVVNAVLLQPLPYPDPDGLVSVEEYQAGERNPTFSPRDFLDMKEASRSFEYMVGYRGHSVSYSGAERPERIEAQNVTPDFFQAFGVEPVVGRFFDPVPEVEPEGKVVVLSHASWQTRFGGDTSVLGRALTLNGEPHTVVGVAPASFEFEDGVEMWIRSYRDWVPEPPVDIGEDLASIRGLGYFSVLGRLAADVPLDRARSEMEMISRQLAVADEEERFGYSVGLIPLQESIVGEVRPALLVLLGAVGLVLLIACANVANLLMARSSTRSQELAVRASLGASRLRLFRQLVVESLLLGGVAGGLGLGLARWGFGGLLLLLPTDIPRMEGITLDSSVLLFTLGASIVTGLVFGLIPALEASKTDLGSALKEGGRGLVGGGAARHRREILVAVEVALSMVLLSGAGLLMKSLIRLQDEEVGFEPENVLVMRMSIPEARYPDEESMETFVREMLGGVEAVPGISSAGVALAAPFTGGAATMSYDVEGVVPGEGEDFSSEYQVVTPDYFLTMGIPLLAGRTPEAVDDEVEGGADVIVVNEAFAQRHWGEESPLGQRVTFDGENYREIIGVVGNVRHFAFDRAPRPEAYYSYYSDPWPFLSLVVKTEVDPWSLAEPVRRQILAVDPDQPVYAVSPMEEMLSESTGQRRFTMELLGIFAALAILLAVVGVYGVMAYSVSLRIHEMGIRAALGAGRGEILRLTLGSGLRMATIGLAAGVVGSLGLTRFMSSLLYGVSPTDPMVLSLTALLLTGTVMMAAYLPAERATRVDPASVLRYE